MSYYPCNVCRICYGLSFIFMTYFCHSSLNLFWSLLPEFISLFKGLSFGFAGLFYYTIVSISLFSSVIFIVLFYVLWILLAFLILTLTYHSNSQAAFNVTVELRHEITPTYVTYAWPWPQLSIWKPSALC